MKRTTAIRCIYILVDSISSILAVFAFNVVRFFLEIQSLNSGWTDLFSYLFFPRNLLVSSLICLFWLIIFAISGYYNRPINKSRINELALSLLSIFIGSTLLFFALILNDKVALPSIHIRLYILSFILFFTCIYLSRLVLTSILLRQREKQEFWPKVLLIGTPKEIKKLNSLSQKMRFHSTAEVIFENGEKEDLRIHEEIKHLLATKQVSDIYLFAQRQQMDYLGQLLYQLYPYHCGLHIATDDILLSNSIHSTILDGIPLIDINHTKMSEFEKNVKYLFDRVFSLLFLFLLSPLFLILALLVRLSSKGKIFYAQERIGKRGKPFKIYKFRTMYTNSEKDGPSLSYEGDPRITAIGKLLRKYRLDELPQFFNVLKGDMSFVGPRPERQYYINQIIASAPYFYLLHNVRPGITSWGMVKYGYASTLEEMLERVKYDWFYYTNMSIKLDITILLHTITILVKGTGK